MRALRSAMVVGLTLTVAALATGQNEQIQAANDIMRGSCASSIPACASALTRVRSLARGRFRRLRCM